MPLSTQHPAADSSSYVLNHVSRAWYRSIELPPEDKNMDLCARHRFMDLKRSDFAARPQEQTLPPDWHFGKLSEVIERSDYYNFCKMIVNSVSTIAYQDEVDVLGCWIPDVTYNVKDAQTDVKTTMDVFTPFNIVPLARENEDGMFLGRKLNPKSIEIGLLRSWLQSCEDWHKAVCWRTNNSRRDGPVTIKFPIQPFIRLLDLKNDCLIQTSMPPVFVALSYVWGNAKMFKLIKETLPNLMQSGSFKKSHELFPKSIQDADDESDKTTQVQLMDTIFTRACFTITAASGGDANAGLPGVEEGSRNITQHTAIYSDELTLLSLMRGCDDVVDKSTWNGRCWTYQEHVYMSASLHTITPSRGEEPPVLVHGHRNRLGISKGHYLRMIAEYTLRDMTFLVDRISGFEGILNVFRKPFGPVFVWGMWSGEMLGHSLLWQPQQLLHRVPIDEKSEEPIYPSWSWAGWSGAVKYYDPEDWNGLPPLKDPWARVSPSEYGESVEINRDNTSLGSVQVPMYHLQLHTRIGSFRLTLDDGSGTPKPKSLSKTHGEHPTRFGITTVQPADFGTEEEWLGTILLPASYQQKLSDEHEFVVLSSAFCFVSDELSLDASSALEPYAAINVMLITRQSTAADDGKLVVVLAGVGRMLKKAWDMTEVRWEDMLVA
ncbi:hypothetical protein V501_09048 [Pseudogymnoascus sp. VKM F-4519 (FW-2642)]|nr:hypothetical protein V501_09048 [Pseudogymnoascus sp. VKM F-4519 (FW-2642)]